MTDLNTAASNLVHLIEAPRGAVNALEAVDDNGGYIRLLIDPTCWLTLPDLPRVFEGYRVVVERRELSIAQH
jgi:hypothetical protein